MTVLFYDNPGCFPGAAWIFAWIICDRHLIFAVRAEVGNNYIYVIILYNYGNR